MRPGALFADLRRREVYQAAAVYIVGAWAILQASDVLFPGAGIPDSSIRFVFIGAVLVFPLALIFAWKYDLTLRGLFRTPDASRAAVGPLPLERRDYVVLGTLSVAGLLTIGIVSIQVMATAVPDAPRAVARQAAENSIAVLPFVSMSDDKEDEYFGDGIAEELLNELANLNSLQVAARTSSFFFKGKNLPIQDIGRQLGVRNVLEGSVRRAGSRLRVTAQLISVADGYHLWSETYDREKGDIFEVQEDIARAITSALEVTVLGKESSRLAQAPTESFDAYDYYLLGRHQRQLRNPASIEKSIELFQKALAIDDQFALGYAALAASYVFQTYLDVSTPEDAAALATPLAERALQLDPELPQAHAASGSIRLMLRDFDAADASYRRAVELQPSYAAGFQNLGLSMVLQSRLNEADQYYSQARVLNPVDANLTFNVGAMYMLSGRFEEGMDALLEVMALVPDRANTKWAMVHWSISYGHYEDALRWVLDPLAFEPGSVRQVTYLARIYMGLGMWVEARRYLGRARELSSAPEGLRNLTAEFLFASGDHVGLGELVAAQFEQADETDDARYSPTNRFRYLWRGIAAVTMGNYLQAERDLTIAAGGEEGIAAAVYDDIRPLKYLAYTYQQTGRPDEASALLDHCLELALDAHARGWDTPISRIRTAQIYAVQNDVENTLAQLEAVLARGWRFAGELEMDPLWDNLQSDVRFQEIVRRVNGDLQVMREGAATFLRAE